MFCFAYDMFLVYEKTGAYEAMRPIIKASHADKRLAKRLCMKHWLPVADDDIVSVIDFNSCTCYLSVSAAAC